MGTKKLPLDVEWTNGVVSNEIQDGIKPQYIILKGGEKMLLEALNIDLPAEGNTTVKGIAFLYLKNGAPTPFNGKMLHENIDSINSTLIGLGISFAPQKSNREIWQTPSSQQTARPRLKL